MTYFNNLVLVPVSSTDTTFCRHCGKKISVEEASSHLIGCRPDIARAIAREYNKKERAAILRAYGSFSF